MMIRTIQQAAAILKQSDPETPITEYVLRRWILSGELPTIKSGNKYLINMDVLKNYLNGNKEGTEHEYKIQS